MREAMEAGVVPFIAIKCGLTLLGIAFLCMHKNFRWVKSVIAGVLVLYTGLFFYHLYLATLTG